MLRLNLKDLPIGAKLRHDIYSTAGQLLLKKGISPSNNMIEQLEKLGITEVIIYQEAAPRYTAIKFDDSGLLKSFASAQTAVTSLVKQIASDKPVAASELTQAAQSIYPEVLATNNIIKYLHSVHKANDYTKDHSLAVSVLSVKIGHCLGLEKSQLKALALAGLLHDVGKYKVSQDIINKPSKLTTEELVEIKKHPVYGYRLVKNMGLDNQAVELAVLQHHEHLDGWGYPVGLTGDNIHLYARIVAVADVFDALTSHRSYSIPITAFKAAEEMQRSCFGHLDPNITRRFLRYLFNVSPGDQVFLNNGETASVIMFNFDNPNRPLVRTANRFIDLEQELDFHIVKVL